MRATILAAVLLGIGTASACADDGIQLGPRPLFLVERMAEGPLKDTLRQCQGPFKRTNFSIGHRGAAMQFPEHTRESYIAAARMGAGIIECDVTFTKDRALVCRHSQCDLHTTTDILAIPDLAAKCTQGFSPADPATGKRASAKCCTSDLTLAEFRRLRGRMDGANPNARTVEDYLKRTPGWRTDLYAAAAGTPMTHAESIALIKSLGAKFTPELKAPEVTMPFGGDYTQEKYAQQMIDEYRRAGIDPRDVFPQSFDLKDILYWLKAEPAFGAQAIFLDGRNRDRRFNTADAATWTPSMQALADMGVKYLGPPLWMLLTLDGAKIAPSPYAKAAKAAGLGIIAWTIERDGPLANGGGWYHQSVRSAISREGDAFAVLDVLAREVGIRGIFSDWPATATFYANCMGIE